MNEYVSTHVQLYFHLKVCNWCLFFVFFAFLLDRLHDQDIITVFVIGNYFSNHLSDLTLVYIVDLHQASPLYRAFSKG
jgi:hypothetical protein